MKPKAEIPKATRYIIEICCLHIKKIIVILVLLFIMSVCNAVLPQISIQIIDNGFIAKNVGVVIRFSLLSFCITTAVSLLYIIVEHIRLRGYNSIQTRLKSEMLDKLLYVKCEYFSEKSPTAVFQQLDEDINAISNCFSSEILLSVMQIFLSVALIPILCRISWKLSILLFLVIPVNLIQTAVFSKVGYHIAKKKINIKNEYSSWVSDVVSGIQTIHCFGISKYFRSVFHVRQKDITDIQYRQEMVLQANIRLEAMFSEAIVLVFYVVGGYLVAGNELTVGQFIAFQTYSLGILSFIEQFMNIIYGYSLIKPSIERFLLFLNEPEEISGGQIAAADKVNIEFRNVSFGFDNSKPIFRNINICIFSGNHIAIIGKNGCGKTTLINLLLRLYQPQIGKILVNDIDVSLYDINNYRRLFSVVSQNPYLFCDTIKNNICLYQDISEEKLEWAIKLVGLSKLIEEKTLSYCVGQNGCELSGGQRQRISIARTLIHDSPIVILDEPETNLDIDFKVLLKQLMQESYRNRTVIAITHHSELYQYMDQIYKIDEITKDIVRICRGDMI